MPCDVVAAGFERPRGEGPPAGFLAHLAAAGSVGLDGGPYLGWALGLSFFYFFKLINRGRHQALPLLIAVNIVLVGRQPGCPPAKIIFDLLQ